VPGRIISTFSESATLTAANGDRIELTGSGTACAGGGQSTATATLTMTEGTGRFAGVTGSLSEQIAHDLVSGFEHVVLSGRISAPGS
jgi:osmotically-inducible protein OsmY